MIHIITPRNWIKGEIKRLIEITERSTLSDEEKVDLVKARLNKFLNQIENPMMYRDELK